MKYLPFVFLFLIYACTHTGEQTSKNKSSDTLNSDTLSYTYQELTKASKYLVENGTSVDSTYFRVYHPKFLDAVITGLVHSAIWLEGEDGFEEAAQAFIEGYDEFVEEESTHRVSMPWFKEIQSSVCLNTPRLLTLKTTYQQYTGGAHGNTVVIWSNYDVVQHQKIQLSDFIIKEKLPALTKMAEQQFRKMENLADTVSLEKDFFFEHGIFALNDNFGLTKDGLLFYYNEYEIKPYSEGSTTIKLPYADLKDFLSNRGKEYVKDIEKVIAYDKKTH